jgi:hypothetical protein
MEPFGRNADVLPRREGPMVEVAGGRSVREAKNLQHTPIVILALLHREDPVSWVAIATIDCQGTFACSIFMIGRRESLVAASLLVPSSSTKQCGVDPR